MVRCHVGTWLRKFHRYQVPTWHLLPYFSSFHTPFPLIAVGVNVCAYSHQIVVFYDGVGAYVDTYKLLLPNLSANLPKG